MRKEIGIIVKMESIINELPKSEKKVILYILKHPEEVIRLSVSDLAVKSGVSDATVIRSCYKLGLTGFQDLKISLAQGLVSPIKSINETIKEDDTYETIITKVFNATMNTLKKTMSILDYNSVKEASNLVYHARRVVIIGLGNSAAMAQDMYHKLLRLGCNATVCTDTHIQMILACGTTEHDVLVAISHSGSSKDIVEVAKAWKNGGGKIISITNIGLTPLNKISDVSLETASRETQYKVYAFSSRAAQMAIIDAIYTLIAVEYRDKMSDRFIQIDQVLKEKKY